MKYFALFIMIIAACFGIDGRYDYTDKSSLEAISKSNVEYVSPSSVDSSYVIMAQLNKIASTGGTVVIPDGIYYLGSTITIPGNNITIEMGRGTIIRPLSNHTFTKVDYRSNGTYNMVPIFYATGRSNVHIIGGKIDWDWAETELTITAVSGSDVTVAENLTGKVAVNDYVHTMETADPSQAQSSVPGKVSVVSVNGGTGATTLTLSAKATSLAANDKLMYGGPVNNPDYLAESWAPIWLDNCTDSTVEDVYVDSGAYYQNMYTGRGYCVLFSRCTDCRGENIKAYKGGYECLGIRDSNLRTGFVNCTARYGRRHSAQLADWAPTISGTARNQSCYFSSLDCDDTIIIHGGLASAERNHRITNCTATTIQLTGNVSGAIVMQNHIAYLNQLLLGNYDQEENIVMGNILYQDDSAGTKVAMRIYANQTSTLPSFKNMAIMNNVIHGGRVLITCDNISTGNFKVDGLNFLNNIMVNTYAGNHGIDFNLPNGSNLTLTDIVVRNNSIKLSTTTPTAVLNIPGKDSTINRLVVSDNSLIGGYFTYNTEAADSDYRQDDFYFSNNFAKPQFSVFRFNGTPDINGAYMLNNWLYGTGYMWSDPGGIVADGWINGNYIKNWNNMFSSGGLENPVLGYNNCPNVGYEVGTETLLWRTRVDIADPDKSYLEQNVGGTWTVVGTTDRTP